MPNKERVHESLPATIAPLAQLCGTAMGLVAFAMMTLRGVWVGNPIEVVLGRAVAGLLCGTMLGGVVGWVAARVIEERRTENQSPSPADDSAETDPSSEEEPVESMAA